MNTLPKKTTTVDSHGHIELYHRVLDNLVRVENGDAGVVVRLMRDNFSASAKTILIRHLAMEGFIPDRFQWYSEGSDCAALAVQWVVDGSWVRINHRRNRLTTRILSHLTRGRLLALCLFLVALTVAAWWKSH
jgi:hypothetical protein